MKENKAKEYPTLNPQQLLSLIRANQLMHSVTEDRLLVCEHRLRDLEKK